MTTKFSYLLEAKSLEECITILQHKVHSLNEYYAEVSPGSDTLISVNPFKTIPELFSAQVMNQYNKCELNTPHIFKYATNALEAVLNATNPLNQTILVTGESGSGKTSAINYLMSYFSHVTKQQTVETTTTTRTIESMLLCTNPILEAFGNASTIQNENSSRFGKYIELRFNSINENKTLSSVKLITYLLEKTRATRLPDNSNERNFHIFYQIISGATDLERCEWHLTDKLINNFKSNLLKDKLNWQLVKNSFNLLRIDNYSEIFKLISCICHLNMSLHELDSPSHLLGFADSSNLNSYLTFQELSIATSANTVKRLCTSAESRLRKDALTKLIYVQLFKWLVSELNHRLSDHYHENNSLNNKFIGLLDIYGFENLIDNSLEQLCINYANEKLHQIFVDSHLKSVQQEFLTELIEWINIDCDNIEILTQLESFQHKGLFTILNEECMLRRDLVSRRCSEQTTANLLNKILNTNHKLICESKPYKENTFTVCHYAGCVDYKVDDLIEKNKDQIPDDLMRFLNKSNNSFLLKILAINKNLLKNNKKKTVIDKFKLNLSNLVTKLKEAQIYYVRCIRPNHLKRSDQFDSKLVKKQLEACGLNALLELSRRFNYRHRLEYSKFCAKYSLLKLNKQFLNEKDLTRQIIEQVINTNDCYRLGKTKIFLNDLLNDKLNIELKRSKSAIIIQSLWRMYMTRNDYKLKLKSVRCLQKWFRKLSVNNSKRNLIFGSTTSETSVSQLSTNSASTISLTSCSSSLDQD